MFDKIGEVFTDLLGVISTMEFIDIVDIVLLTYIFYLLLKLIRETRAGQLVKGILFLVAGYIISFNTGMKAISFFLEKILNIGVLAMIILFQPELRRALEKAGRSKFGIRLFGLGQSNSERKLLWANAIDSICDSCVELSASCTGALIVIERQVRLGEQIETGTILNATPSKEVFGNIFYPKAPLHDGAVIMRDGFILAAACFLPKPQKDASINKKLGSRHRAAIGMSENSDAVVIVVSEETGQISVALNGNLTRDYTREKLRKVLEATIYNDIKEIEIGKKKLFSFFSGRSDK